MANNLKYAVTLKNARLDAITTAIASSGLLAIYSGTQPTNPDTALGAQVKLAELACSATFAAGASGGVLTISTISADSSADATGTATWFTFTTSGGTRKIDGTIGTSGCDLTIDNTSIVSGQAVSVTPSITITSAN